MVLILTLLLCLSAGCGKQPQNTDINSDYLSADNYEMELNFDNLSKTLNGTVSITVTNKTHSSLKELYIRNYTANITDSNITDFEVSGKRLKSYINEEDKSVITITLDKKLKPKTTITISMNFETKVPKKKEKFGYAVFEEKEIYNLSTCFPTLSFFDGEKWYNHPYIESFGESNLSHLSNYSVTVNIPDGFSVVATGAQTVKENIAKIKGENLREFAMVISNSFKNISETVNGTKINYYYLNFENNTNFSKAILKASVDSYKLFTDYLGDYIHNELDVVHTFMDSAMEYSGLLMLGYPDVSDDDIINLDKAIIENGILSAQQSRVAHEVAHQWFYSAVGNDPFSEPWLDEGFAEFCEDIIYQNTLRNVDEKEKFNLFMKDYIKQVTKDSYIINKGYQNYTKDENYSMYVYEGGKMFLYELREILGEEDFQQALREYYSSYKNKIATTQDFLKIIEKIDGENKTDSIIKKYIDKTLTD